MPFKPGDRIERYVIDAPLGRGGMGEVYRAHDERLQRSVALKILHTGGSAVPVGSKPVTDGAARMLREARAAAALDHPNVVAIFDVGQISEPEELRGTTYLAMELIKGRSLRTFVGDANVSIKERLDWLADIARALAAAHAAGLVHRDVKPENVMIREDRRVKVLDFGIAKRAASDVVDPTSSTEGYVVPTLTTQGVVVGTPVYMAPEQLRGEVLDGRADQFAWGVLAYELLTGRRPWSSEGGAIALVSQILSAPVPPFDPQSSVPASAMRTVTRALAKDREERFASMDELLGALAGAVVSPFAETSAFAPVSSRASLSGAQPASTSPPVAPLTRPARSARRANNRRAWTGVGAALLFTAGVATVAVMSARSRARDEKKKAASSSVASAKASMTGGCTSNRACALEHGGEAYVCRASDHACVAVASPDCKAMYEPRDLASDDTVWLGALFPATGAEAEDWGRMNLDGVDFARKEVAQVTGDLERSSRSLRVRNVALVGCDDAADAARAAHHLVDDVGVPAILGFRSGQEVIDLAGSFLDERGVASVASMTFNPQITRLPQPAGQPRLVWRTTYNFDSLAEATASLVHDAIEPRAGGGHTRVVVIRSDSVASLGFADTFYRRLVFNGKSAIENGHDYQEIVLGKEGPDASQEQVERQVVAAAPTIVVFLAQPESVLAIAQTVDADLPGSAKRPTYVVVNDGSVTLAPFVGTNAQRRRRVLAVNSPSNSAANARFVIRYNQARHASVTRTLNPGVSYDAFYLLAYATFALPSDAPVTGLALAGRFARLVGPGKTIEVGPTGLFEGLNVLSGGSDASIDLEGTQSGLDFDLKTGEAPSDFVLLCPAIDERGRATGEDVESGVVYRAKTRRAEGTLKCP